MSRIRTDHYVLCLMLHHHLLRLISSQRLNKTEDDKPIPDLLNDFVMDFETSTSRDEPNIYGSHLKPARARD